MVHKSKKLTAVYALIMDLPLSILITLISLVLAGNLAAPMFIRMAILAYAITFFVNFLPRYVDEFGKIRKKQEVITHVKEAKWYKIDKINKFIRELFTKYGLDKLSCTRF